MARKEEEEKPKAFGHMLTRIHEIRVSSYFPFPNSRLIPGFSGFPLPKIPKILLANSNVN